MVVWLWFFRNGKFEISYENIKVDMDVWYVSLNSFMFFLLIEGIRVCCCLFFGFVLVSFFFFVYEYVILIVDKGYFKNLFRV